MATRMVYALLLTAGLVSGHRAHGKAKLNLGPYPLEVATLEPQDVDLSWYDPAKTVKRVQEANAKPQAIKLLALKESGGDRMKAVESLLARSKEPDAADGLFQFMAELAIQVPGVAQTEGTPEAPPQVAGSPFQIGIHAVAKVAEALKGRYGTKEMGHFDAPLMERAILLMGFHGAPDLPGVRKVPLANGKGEVPPIDPLVRATLRGLLKGGDLPQILAARALGQLGDPGTAKEIIDHPGRYPGASIADFGPGAVESFKQKRLKELSRGVEGFDNFVQGMRLTPRYQDTAIDLARAGDAGAGMAMERNFAIEHMYAKDPDALMASYFDRALRFHGTRMGFIGEQGAKNFDMQPGWDYGPTWPKSKEVMLRILDHNLNLVFNTKGWRVTDLVDVGRWSIGMLTAYWHAHKYRFHLNAGELDPKGFDSFYLSAEKLFRKYYKKTVYPLWNDDYRLDPRSEMRGINRYARHLGLDAVDFQGRDTFSFRVARLSEISDPERNQDPLAYEKEGQDLAHGFDDWQCIRLGHLKEGEPL